MNSARTNEIWALHYEGMGGRRIAAKLGLSYGRVRYILERPDVTRPPITATTKPAPIPWACTPLRAVVWDIECTDLRSDLGILLCAAFLDLATGELVIKSLEDFDRDEHRLVLWVRDQVAAADILIGHNSTGFDKCFINGVLARYREDALPARIHIDTYQIARNGFKGRASSNSLRNLAEFFGLPVQKDHMTKAQWRMAPIDSRAMTDLRNHCETDVMCTAQLWQVMKPYWFRWKGV